MICPLKPTVAALPETFTRQVNALGQREHDCMVHSLILYIARNLVTLRCLPPMELSKARPRHSGIGMLFIRTRKSPARQAVSNIRLQHCPMCSKPCLEVAVTQDSSLEEHGVDGTLIVGAPCTTTC